MTRFWALPGTLDGAGWSSHGCRLHMVRLDLANGWDGLSTAAIGQQLGSFEVLHRLHHIVQRRHDIRVRQG